MKHRKRQITFIDTPGHEAFAKMRGRGLSASDIGLLVVSSIDGVMPQTKESIKLLSETKIPFIVVLTKSDLPDKNTERVKRQLLKEEVMLEGYGGDVPAIEVSAKAAFDGAKINTNIKELLELILLVFEVKGNPPAEDMGRFKAIVIESGLDQKAGPRATIVIKDGLLSVGDKIFCEGIEARVRTIIDDKGEHLKAAYIGDAVGVLGFEKVPSVGSIVMKRGPDKEISNFDKGLSARAIPQSLFLSEEKPSLSVIICADTVGSLEAIVNALPKEVLVVVQKTGDISPSDILLAKSVGAVILGFNIKMNPEVSRLAFQEKVLVKNYNLIFELIDEITDVLRGKELEVEKQILGKTKVLASFPFEKTKVLGITVLEGRVARGDRVRLIRNDQIVGESRISSIRIGKNPVSKVEKGHEAGVMISPFLDLSLIHI